MKSMKETRILACAIDLVVLLSLCLLGMQAQASQSTINPLFSFPCDTNGACRDGSAPNQLIQASDGNFYGVTQHGAGSNQLSGTLYRITPSGQFTLLFTFAPGIDLADAFVEANDGFLYGTAFDGGATNNGILFRISKTGSGFQVVHSFCSEANCADGGFPDALILGHDGNLDGSAMFGGDASCACGTIFRVTPPGTFSTLHVFQSSGGGAPASLIQGSDGTFFAIAGKGVSRFSRDWQLTTLMTFPPIGFDPCGGSGLMEAANGKLYGASSCYQLAQLQFYEASPSGKSSHKFSFDGKHFGFVPSLIQGSDGNLWDNIDRRNIVFAVSPATGKIIKSFAFDGANGSSPGEAPVVQGSDGKLYGTASVGGADDGGTVWVLDAELPAPASAVAAFTPTSAAVGAKVLIRGDHFIGSTAVTFNGVNAAFKVLNRNFISATVPAGATSGAIAVTNPGGTTASKKSFVVK